MNPPIDHSSPFARLMGPRTLWWLIGVTLIATLIFRRAPIIDIESARLFYDNGFYIAHDPFWRGVRRASIYLTIILIVLMLVFWLARLFKPEGTRRVPFAKLGFPTLSLLIGPYVITNLIFKGQWGRPRPKHLESFGGDATHVLPWDLSDQCATNCSFISGETSTAIWLMVFIPLLPLAWHRRALWAIAIYTILISILRIAFGGHFLSDMVFSVLINTMVIWWVWGLFFERKDTITVRAWATETRAAGPFHRFGAPFRRTAHKITHTLKLAYSSVMDKVRQKS
ncbi:MAG: phosphatase PAP2 family protein [Hyphomicrobiales bacterium]